MKQRAWFLIVLSTLSCGSAWAGIAVSEASGKVQGVLDVPGYYPAIDGYSVTGAIDPPLTHSASYNVGVSARTEVGLWYAETEISIPGGEYRFDGTATGAAYLTPGSDRLDLGWTFTSLGSYSGAGGVWPITGEGWLWLRGGWGYFEYLFHKDLASWSSDPWVGGITLTDLNPSDTYLLEWGTRGIIGGGGWTDNVLSSRIEIHGLPEVQAVPLPASVLLGVFAVGYAGLRLNTVSRRRTSS